jgi:hypothetical protein
MTSPYLVPGTDTLYWHGSGGSTGIDTLSIQDTADNVVIDAIHAVDFSLQPAILIIVDLTSFTGYTAGASASIGGNPMSIIIDGGGRGPLDGSGQFALAACCLLPYDASTTFPDATFILTTPGTGSLEGFVASLRLLYQVDPVLNYGFGAGYVLAGSLADVTTTPAVDALADDFAVATWCNLGAASPPNAGYVVTQPSTVITYQNTNFCNSSISTGLVPSDGPYNAFAHRTPFAPQWWFGAAVVLALLRSAPPTAVFVPNVVGDTLSVGEAAIIAVGLVIGPVTTASSFTVAAGIILSTNPPAGTETFTGRPVAIVISSGPPPLWTLTPDWATPVRERLGFLTDALPAWTGYEQRRSLRIAPRRVFSFAMLAGSREKRFIENALFGWSALIWYLPIFPDGQRLAAPISIGDTAIACDTVNRDFSNGGLAIAIQDALTAEAFLVASVSSSSLTLSAPAAAAWPAGTRIYPLRSARLLVYPKILHDSQDMWSMSADFTINEPCDWPAATGLATYRTLPVLEDSPDVSSAPAGDYSREANIIDSTTGAIDVDDTAQLGFPGIVHQWFLKGRTARSNFRKLLYLLKGRARMIWVPSYNADLLLIGTLGSSAVAMTVEAAGLAQLAAVQNRRDIRIELLTGAVYYRRIASVAAGMTSATEVATLDSSLGSAISAAQVRRISFMTVSRLDADEIEIQHLTMADGIATAQTRFTALNYET